MPVRYGESYDLDLENARYDDVSPMFERIDGECYEIGTDEYAAAVVRHRVELESNEKRSAALKQRLDAIEVERGDLAAQRAEIEKAKARVEELVRHRVHVMDVARRELGEQVRLDGMNDQELELAVANKVLPNLRLSASDRADRIRAAFDASVAELDKRRNDSGAAAHAQVFRSILQAARNDGIDVIERVREEQHAASRNAWKQPLSYTRNAALEAQRAVVK